MKNIWIGAVVPLLLLWGVLASQAWPSHHDGDETARACVAIAQGYAKYVKATQTKDIAAAVELYDQDATVLPPGRRPTVGKAAIADFYKQFYSAPGNLLNESFTPVSSGRTGRIRTGHRGGARGGCCPQSGHGLLPRQELCRLEKAGGRLLEDLPRYVG